MDTFNTCFLDVIKNKYAAFNGRARRKEYWMFTLLWGVVVIALSIISGVLGLISSVLSLIFSLVILAFILGTIVPYLALGFRRMQDVNKPGWFIFIPVYSLILAITEGDKGNNQFGSDPKAN